jgi:hypothetical protein
MSLLDTASLIVTPNGYKASKLYSIVPSDGTGDMTMSRTGNTATRVNSSGVIETVNANIPRLDYLGSTCPKLLMEPQRTNLFTYTTSIGDSNTSKNNVTATSDSSVLPDGSTSGYKITGNAGALIKYITKVLVTTTQGTYTLSYFVKYVDEQYVVLRSFIDGTNGSRQRFDILNGTLNGSIVNEGSGVGSNSKIEAYANGWYRISLTITYSTSVTLLRGEVWLDNYSTTSKTTSFLVYGAQLELGTFATSYIPTTTASVTRNADFSNKTSISALLNASQGTYVFKYQNIKPSTAGSTVPFEISNGTDANKIGLFFNANAGRIRLRINAAGSLTEIETASYTTTDLLIIVARYSSTDLTLWINGTLVSTTTSPVVMSALDRITFGQWWGGTPAEGKIEKLAYWKTALTNSECLTLSQS